jgi:aryl-alcohol dehydrogenase-like predicted oxidoreductase
MELITLWDEQQVPRIGFGCWAIGGPFFMDGRPDGWGDVDDRESLGALALAHELGARLFDTSDAYGTGHSEELLGRAFAHRQDVVIATKFGFTYDRTRRELTGTDVTPAYARQACAASLKRLRRETINLFQIHVGEMSESEADALGETLERLVEEGRIRAWGWSTDNADAAKRMLKYPHFRAVQQELSLFHGSPELVELCEANGLIDLNRSPLAMGLLTGKFTATSELPPDDVRCAGHSWVHDFKDGRPTPKALRRLAALRDLLTTDGRTVAQGALGWLLARSPQTLPIPGFKTEAQIRDNFGAADKGPLPQTVMDDIAALLAGKHSAMP